MTNPDDFTASARRAESVLTSALNTWKSGLESVTNQFRAFPDVGNLPHVDATEAVERQFAIIKQVVDLNHQYARQLAEVANTLTGATRQQLESVSGAVREQVQTAAETARDDVDELGRTARATADQVEESERAAREEVEVSERAAREEVEEARQQQEREAATAERRERTQARDESRQRYQRLSKSELIDEAGRRNLPRSGTVNQLVDRLVADDTK